MNIFSRNSLAPAQSVQLQAARAAYSGALEAQRRQSSQEVDRGVAQARQALGDAVAKAVAARVGPLESEIQNDKALRSRLLKILGNYSLSCDPALGASPGSSISWERLMEELFPRPSGDEWVAARAEALKELGL